MRTFGEVNGVTPGDLFENRDALAKAGVQLNIALKNPQVNITKQKESNLHLTVLLEIIKKQKM